MQIRTTLALATASLALCAPAATAAPDGYQPQLKENAHLDVIDRYLANDGPDGYQPQLLADRGPDAVERFLANRHRGATGC